MSVEIVLFEVNQKAELLCFRGWSCRRLPANSCASSYGKSSPAEPSATAKRLTSKKWRVHGISVFGVVTRNHQIPNDWVFEMIEYLKREEKDRDKSRCVISWRSCFWNVTPIFVTKLLLLISSQGFCHYIYSRVARRDCLFFYYFLSLVRRIQDWCLDR